VVPTRIRATVLVADQFRSFLVSRLSNALLPVVGGRGEVRAGAPLSCGKAGP
jgi:hypothetical protein